MIRMFVLIWQAQNEHIHAQNRLILVWHAICGCQPLCKLRILYAAWISGLFADGLSALSLLCDWQDQLENPGTGLETYPTNNAISIVCVAWRTMESRLEGWAGRERAPSSLLIYSRGPATLIDEMNPTVSIGSVSLGQGAPLALIAGPCVIESAEHARTMARALAEASQRLGAGLVFKASYDKANRSSIHSYRGPGLKEGLAILASIKKEFGLPVLSDVHSVEQIGPASEALDCLQIPAFLCRQTDLIAAAAGSGLPVNVKKGQFMAPWDMENVLEKIVASGGSDALITERGASFGYNRLVADMTSLVVLRRLGVPIVFDATHAVQLPGGQGTASGGNREFVAPLARAAAAVGVDALFLETHDNPDQALSDGPNSLPLAEFESLAREVARIAGP
jgi:2-dehydro-3-deoxyphosphooctonate aldolase (KDO 8-P synthase)